MSKVRTGVRTAWAAAASLAVVAALPGVARAAPGDLDPTFGTGGKVVTDIANAEDSQGLVIQADGKVLTVGTVWEFEGPGDFTLVRHLPNGAPDPDFGRGDGVAVADMNGGSNDEAYGAAVQADGKIVVAGHSDLPDGSRRLLTVARFHPDGTLDTGFGDNGKVFPDFGPSVSSSAQEVVVQGDGRIVVAGSVGGDFAVARLDPAGTLDTGFGGGDGWVTTAFPAGFSTAFDVAVRPDGKIVAAGQAGTVTPTSAPDFALARYNPDGSPDPGFGSGGQVTTAFAGEDIARGLALQPDGKTVAGGYSDLNFALARYNEDGSLDAGFGSGGRVTSAFGTARASDVALQADGKILAVGSHQSDLALARYHTDGSLDTGFGTGGLVHTDFGLGAWDEGRAVAVQPDGKIVASGMGYGDNFVVARYQSAGPPAPADVDLSVTKTGPASVSIGDQATYRVTVRNTSTAASATAVTLADTLTGPGTVISATTGPGGSCTTTATSANCALGTLAPGASATVTVVAEPRATGTLTDTATADAAEPDPAPGNDRATASTAVNNARGCTITGTSGPDTLNGGYGNDVICGLGGNDTIRPGYGSDTVHAGSGDDYVDGGHHNDTLIGGPGRDTLLGNYGNDTLNTVDGVAGNDRADGGYGTDSCATDAGDTRISCP
ncbi:calcium-binding protein [Streptomyces sp. NPDC003042]